LPAGSEDASTGRFATTGSIAAGPCACRPIRGTSAIAANAACPAVNRVVLERGAAQDERAACGRINSAALGCTSFARAAACTGFSSGCFGISSTSAVASRSAASRVRRDGSEGHSQLTVEDEESSALGNPSGPTRTPASSNALGTVGRTARSTIAAGLGRDAIVVDCGI
jgi:hypothetical protein